MRKVLVSLVVLVGCSQAVSARPHPILDRLRGQRPAVQGACNTEATKAYPQGPVGTAIHTTGRIIESTGFRLRTFGGGTCATGNCGVR